MLMIIENEKLYLYINGNKNDNDDIHDDGDDDNDANYIIIIASSIVHHMNQMCIFSCGKLCKHWWWWLTQFESTWGNGVKGFFYENISPRSSALQ